MIAIRFRDLLFVCWYSKFAIGRFFQVSCGTGDLLVLSSAIISDYILVLIARNIRFSRSDLISDMIGWSLDFGYLNVI